MTSHSSSSAAGFTKNLLSLGELTSTELKAILELAETFKSERAERGFKHQLPGTSLALLFERPSTRTRVSFEVGMFELGGHAVVLNLGEMQTSRGESPEDTARVLSRFCQAIAARVASHQTLEKYANASSVPVINALSDKYHPCQTIADLLTIKQLKHKLKGVKIAWVGDGNNVCNSLLIGASLSGAHVSVACPKQYAPLPEALSIARHQSEFSGSKIEVMESPSEAVVGADVVVTDTFVSMGDDEEKAHRLKKFLPRYQINDDLVARAKPDAIFMHCLPAHRGEEVTASVIDGRQSVVWQEAENRLHAQKSILYSMLKQYAKNPK
ncbi:MAG: ornithine carbamoyltransferase [Nitrososphaerales archaeon]|jgi:ornithine carbamoyltransferase